MIRPYLSSDYKKVCEMWQSNNWPSIPEDFLPETGFIVDDKCAGFFYRSDSKLGWIEWIVAHKDLKGKARNDAIEQLITRLIEAGRQYGAKMIFTSVAHEGLIKRYEQHGFQKSDTNMTNLVRVL